MFESWNEMSEQFEQFGLPAKLLQALTRMQFTEPTPIQKAAIPLVLQGRDLLGTAQTGTGKTGAFGIPLIAQLMGDDVGAMLVLTPTRELASQVLANLVQMVPVPNLRSALLIGGDSMLKQFRQLEQKPRIIVGTPGRVNDHLARGSLKLTHTRYLVLDETDRMLDMGFGIQLDRILTFLPQQRQTLMFSATLPPAIVKLSAKYLNNPERVAVGSVNSPVTKIQQEQIDARNADKYQLLVEQLNQRTGSVIVFVKTKFGTQRLADRLYKDMHKADAIHGDLQQRRRDRVIQNFRDKKFRILVATDVAARGLDIPHIETVINFDLPNCPEDYIHRIGRTARAGAEGTAVNLVGSEDQAKWRAIHKLIHGTPLPSVPGQKREDGKDPSRNSKRPKRKFFGGKNKNPAANQNSSRPDGAPRRDSAPRPNPGRKAA